MTLDWIPILPLSFMIVALLCTIALMAYGVWQRIAGLWYRTAAVILTLCWLSGPQLTHPLHRPAPQNALLVVDHSPSMTLNNRHDLVEHATKDIITQAAKLPNLHIHRVDVGGDNKHGTQLFQAIEHEAFNYPNLTGVFLLTDGMNHDTPSQLPPFFKNQNKTIIPLHLLLSAQKEEIDRRIRIINAPPYVLVGQDAHIRLQVDDLGTKEGQPVDIMERHSDGSSSLLSHTVAGHPIELTIPITQAGNTLKEIYASPRSDEVSTRNNNIILKIHGVRNRLRVLLISGVPNQSARVWRQLLKADPSVDLIHFTILRSPDTEDDTPISELALIPFPTHELFEQKIRSFDLIILDGFRNQNILPDAYLNNISTYVRKGGGLLVTAGKELTQYGSLQDTSLSNILPAHVPSNGMIIKAFHPQLTLQGKEHPVTSSLPQLGSWGHEWGSWYRSLKPDIVHGKSLLSTPDGSPLLLLNQVEQGRVAMILTDQTWLWSRGEEGGGPQAELLRNLSHWLMKEPELEENRLETHVENQQLVINRHTITASTARTADVITSTGTHYHVTLFPEHTHSTTLHGSMQLTNDEIQKNILWTVHQDNLTACTASTALNSLENSDLRSTATLLKSLVEMSKGGIFWLGAKKTPNLYQVNENTSLNGPHWMGLPIHQTTINGSTKETPLLPSWIVLPSVLFLLALGWWREGR